MLTIALLVILVISLVPVGVIIFALARVYLSGAAGSPKWDRDQSNDK